MDTKGLVTSKTAWGSLVVVIATVLQIFKIDIGDPSGWVEPIAQLIGAGLALYGRITAVKKIAGIV